ncbi:DUF4145 domain-containing protein [Variovorax sp. ZT4R33]|uniref:DUF4145 domain-containing protein n=1 Tax=Variovorax sp. ZT4R33 TaxID=3443743 RepID=UPI003F47AEBB
MPTLVLNCPHCLANNMGFTYRGQYQYSPSPNERMVLASCNACHKPVVAQLKNPNLQGWDAAKLEGDLLHHRDLQTRAVWPKPVTVSAPDAVPDKVARTFIEAAEARHRRSWNAACGMYRRAMELSLKEFAPDVEAWKLEKRIDKLAAEHRITADMQTWAHELRLDGNEALHGDADATEEMTEQMHHLAQFLLIYLYTLPNQIQAARARRDGSEGLSS